MLQQVAFTTGSRGFIYPFVRWSLPDLFWRRRIRRGPASATDCAPGDCAGPPAPDAHRGPVAHRRSRDGRRARGALSGRRSIHDPIDRLPNARCPRSAGRVEPQPRRRWPRGVPRAAGCHPRPPPLHRMRDDLGDPGRRGGGARHVARTPARILGRRDPSLDRGPLRRLLRAEAATGPRGPNQSRIRQPPPTVIQLTSRPIHFADVRESAHPWLVRERRFGFARRALDRRRRAGLPPARSAGSRRRRSPV